MAATMIPIRNRELARELADLSARLSAQYMVEAVEGLEGAEEGARVWGNLAERLRRHLDADPAPLR